jgi:hypothetical protein
MPRTPPVVVSGMIVLASLTAAAQPAQRTDVFVESRDHPAIAYTTAALSNAVADLDKQLQQGSLHLTFDDRSGYLRSVLDALKVPIESQVLVFSQTSAQAKEITPRNPRAVYFNDTVAVGWVRGAEVLELAGHDRHQGVVFYSLEQKPAGTPRVRRDNSCLLCHLTWDTLGVPGLQVLSTFQMSDDPNAYAMGVVSDHRTPLSDRWGGWYVTGKPGAAAHRGNVPVIVKAEELNKAAGSPPRFNSVAGKFDTRGFPSEYSDVVALMVLEHQTHMTNLLTRLDWEARVAQRSSSPSPSRDSDALSSRVREAIRSLVDYLLFVDEAPLAGRVEGSSGFVERFSAQGPRDRQGRSLRQLDLDRRLFRYPCSYLIYSPAFEALSPAIKDAVYERMWTILSGGDGARQYARLSGADRRAVLEILGDTLKNLPAYFRPPAR